MLAYAEKCRRKGESVMIKIDSVTKNFSDVRSLDNVSVTVPEGSVFGLVGSNGSGKSTLLRILSGTIAPDEGCVLYDGANIWENTSAKATMAYLSDEQFFLPHSSLQDMSVLYESLYATFSRSRFTELANIFELDTRRKIHTFSKGMQKQASLLLGLSVRPKYLFCDETFDGLDPVMRQLVKRIFAEEVAERQLTVILASHNLRELEDICDHIALLHKGKLLFQRDLDDMKLNIQKIQAVFTGEENDTAALLAHMPLMNLERRGSMYTLVVRGAREEIEVQMRALAPKFYEFIPLTLEEIFISEMGDRGYDFAKILA